jgi:uncharacterized protein YdeI (YjbR/CyaY-like superfamily)
VRLGKSSIVARDLPEGGARRTSSSADTVPIRAFKDAKTWDSWLAKNHTATAGIWMRIAKKSSGVKSVTYPEAVEVALCHGWIDGQKRPESETAWLQRFVPRRPRSIWSKINREKALALIAGGKMTPAGLAEIERAKRDGRWEAAYDSATTATIDAEFEKELNRRPKAKSFFEGLSRTNRYAILWRLQTAKKAETRAKRMRTFIEMLEKGETIH